MAGKVAGYGFRFIRNRSLEDLSFTSLTDTPNQLLANRFLTINDAGNAVELSRNLGEGSSTFLGLTDTPDAFGSSGQIPTINPEGTGLIFITPNLGTAQINWDHETLPDGQIPANNRRWYTYTGTENTTRALPLESGITSGWHSFFGNDSTTGTLFLTGDFRGSLIQIALLPQQGCEVSYNGSIFLEGAYRDLITVSNFPDWTGNPLRHDTNYSGFNTNSNGINLNDLAARTALLNRNVRISTRSDRDFLFDLEPLISGNFGLFPIGSGFGVINNGPQDVLIRPGGEDTLVRGSITHNLSNPVRLSPGASITFVRSGQDSWNTTTQSRTITGGLF